jgi:UDP-N-acetylmuramyl pentapeptide phosphotransferase/UDP-N-acetylglucosamine-1-phosphate transferase
VTWLLVIAGSALGSAFVVRLVRDFAVRRALLDHPNDRSSHAVPKPRLGGLGVVTSVLVVGVGLVLAGRAPASLLVALAAVALISLLGLVDDVRPLPVRVRFGVQLLLALAVVAVAWDRLPAAAGSLDPWLPRPALGALAVLWIVWLTNLYNFMDGIDGIAGVQALVAALALATVAVRLGADTSTWLLLALAGSSLGFLLFNFPPSTIFMGDVGSTAVGFLFGVLPLLPEARPVPMEPVALALCPFVLDATTTLLRRVARGERWYTPHRTHLYQRPVVAGASHRAVLAAWGAGMVVAGICAVRWPSSGVLERVVLIAVPVTLFAAGHVTVGRMERHVKSGA